MPKRKKRKSNIIIFLVWLSIIVFAISGGYSAANYILINRNVKIERTDLKTDRENLETKKNSNQSKLLSEQNKAERLSMQIDEKQKELYEAIQNVDIKTYT